MKNYIIVFVCFLVLQSCNTENGWDCIQTVGDIVEVSYDVGSFDKITVEDDIFLEIEKGEEYAVIVKTGANLINDITVVVEPDSTLRLKNNNGCNLVREYNITSIKVTTPTLTDIRSASRNTVTSINTLDFEELEIQSNTNPGVIDAGKSGDFILDVDVEDLIVRANGFSEFTMSGSANTAFVSFNDEIPRFNGENLIVQDLRVLHVSGNKMTVNPQKSITGSIRSTGDVISLNTPPIVDVVELFTGRLIFQ